MIIFIHISNNSMMRLNKCKKPSTRRSKRSLINTKKRRKGERRRITKKHAKHCSERFSSRHTLYLPYHNNFHPQVSVHENKLEKAN